MRYEITLPPFLALHTCVLPGKKIFFFFSTKTLPDPVQYWCVGCCLIIYRNNKLLIHLPDPERVVFLFKKFKPQWERGNLNLNRYCTIHEVGKEWREISKEAGLFFLFIFLSSPLLLLLFAFVSIALCMMQSSQVECPCAPWWWCKRASGGLYYCIKYFVCRLQYSRHATHFGPVRCSSHFTHNMSSASLRAVVHHIYICSATTYVSCIYDN